MSRATAVAAAIPRLFFFFNDTATTEIYTVTEIPKLLLKETDAGPIAVPEGIWKLICRGETKIRPARRITPAESVIWIVAPPNEVGQGAN